MSTAEKKLKVSLAEYFAYCDSIEGKAEFFDGEIFDMAGGTYDHNVVLSNLAGELRSMLKGKNCTALADNQRIEVESGNNYCYADGAVVCGPPQFSELDRNSLKNPTLLIEVSSPSTALYDRTVKFRRYSAIPSLREYVIVQPDLVSVEVLQRTPDDKWLLTHYDYLDQTVMLESLQIALPMSEIYDKVLFLNEEQA
jgi:Uma2 family endonuclease